MEMINTRFEVIVLCTLAADYEATGSDNGLKMTHNVEKWTGLERRIIENLIWKKYTYRVAKHHFPNTRSLKNIRPATNTRQSGDYQ